MASNNVMIVRHKLLENSWLYGKKTNLLKN